MNEKTHPIIQAVVDVLPPAGTAWPEDERRHWLDYMAAAFDQVYQDAPPPRTVSGQKHANRS